MFKIGIIREGKVPFDSRVALSPSQCAAVQEMYGVKVAVQPSATRCFSDAEYEANGIALQQDLSDCDILFGIKEVPIIQLIENKTYCFFSHTIKAQPHNRALLKSVLRKNIRLIDYEAMTELNGARTLAFGRWAGIAGAHNGLTVFGERTGQFTLPQMVQFAHYEDAKTYYQKLRIPYLRIVLTGTGRVASGAAEVLHDMGITQVSPEDYLKTSYRFPVFTQLDGEHYAARKDGSPYVREHFHAFPQDYQSIFAPYYRVTDLMINGIYYDKRAPAFFTAEEMKQADFRIQVIADISCDIVPHSSIPSTLFATTIASPVFGYDKQRGIAVTPFQLHTVDMMTIDNLPNELPRDSSTDFGQQLMENMLPELLGKRPLDMVQRATLAENGKLTSGFAYLQEYVEAKSTYNAH